MGFDTLPGEDPGREGRTPEGDRPAPQGTQG